MSQEILIKAYYTGEKYMKNLICKKKQDWYGIGELALWHFRWLILLQELKNCHFFHRRRRKGFCASLSDDWEVSKEKKSVCCLIWDTEKD